MKLKKIRRQFEKLDVELDGMRGKMLDREEVKHAINYLRKSTNPIQIRLEELTPGSSANGCPAAAKGSPNQETMTPSIQHRLLMLPIGWAVLV